MDGLKRCSKCKIEKCVSEFGKDNSRKDGLRRWCRSCRAISDSKYQQENKVTINEKARISRAERKKKDPVYKFKEVTKCRIRKAIKSSGYKKGSETEKILGCSHEEFRNHIESQFGEGMDWNNHGEWHLDHKIPVSWGENEEEVKALNHYSNFQPLWGKDNLKKGNRRMD
jgi:hypothetical protein